MKRRRIITALLLSVMLVLLSAGSAAAGNWFWDAIDDSVSEFLSDLTDEEDDAADDAADAQDQEEAGGQSSGGQSSGSQSSGSQSSGSQTSGSQSSQSGSQNSSQSKTQKADQSKDGSADDEDSSEAVLDPEGYYYDVESVVLYLDTYGELPLNYITKDEARDLGWEGGSVQQVMDDAAIGGDRFGNREGILPTKKGRQYYECDIDTDGKKSRGAKRLIFSGDGMYFYTEDHYETFTQLTVEDGEIVYGEVYQ